MKNKIYYEKLFETYPDVLTFNQFRSMLGDMNEKIALKILRDDLVKHFCIRRAYYIPKVYAIEYALTDHFAGYTKRRKRYKKQGSGQDLNTIRN